MHQLHDDNIWMPEQGYMGDAHLKMKAPDALSGQSSRVSSAQPPPPTPRAPQAPAPSCRPACAAARQGVDFKEDLKKEREAHSYMPGSLELRKRYITSYIPPRIIQQKTL